MLWKRMNYSAQTGRVNKTAGLSQLKTSLNHSLRTVMKRELEFNQSLANRNYIIANNKIVRLDKLSIEQRKQIVNDILGDIQNDITAHEDTTQLKDDRAKYAYKLKKLLAKTDEPEDFKRLVSTVLEAKEALDPALSDNLTSMGLKRVNDKKNAISIYISLHNEIISASNNSLHRSKTVLQECFFKFPARNKISEVKPADYLKIIHGFHRKNFPNYPIKACVFHGDEVLSQEQINNGVHPHIFISGKNSKTGQYDLVKSQLDFVNQHLKATGEPEIKENSYKSAQKIGETYQKIVYEHVNKKLKEYGYSIEASIHEKTAEHKAKIEKIKQDENKAKILRGFNLLSHTEQSIIDAKKNLNTLEPQIEKSRELNETLTNNNIKLSSSIDMDAKKLTGLKREILSEKQKIKALKETYHKLFDKNDRLETSIKEKGEAYSAIHNVDIAIDIIAFKNEEREDIKHAFNTYKERNMEALKKLSRKERIDFLAANAERFKREKLDRMISTKLTTSEKTSLFIHDTTQTVKRTAKRIRNRLSNP